MVAVYLVKVLKDFLVKCNGTSLVTVGMSR